MARGGGKKPGLEGGRSKQLFKCKVSSCEVTPRGCDLPRHYMNLTNWKLVAKLRAAVGDTEVERLLEGADGHTTYIYRNQYSVWCGLVWCGVWWCVVCSSLFLFVLVLI